jgi:hypothetical protein
MARGFRISVSPTRGPWRRWPLGLLAATTLACTPRLTAWPENEPLQTGPLCYERVPASPRELARLLEAGWARLPETHFTAADLYRLRPASGAAARPDSALFKITEHHYQYTPTHWRLKTANGQVLYAVALRATSPTESQLCAQPLKWLARPLAQAGLTASERTLARQWMALDLARLLPLLPIPQDPAPKQRPNRPSFP